MNIRAHLLETRELEVQIGSVSVCHNLNLSIQPGQCWALMGRNGAGKTTLLHTLAGLHRPMAGEIQIENQPVHHLPRRMVARSIGLLPQDFYDPFPATVMETALIGRHPHLSAWQWEGPADFSCAHNALQRLGLENLAKRYVDTLSGGERRRLGMATLLVQEPRLYLLDEPTNHLDLNHQHGLLSLLQQEAREQNRSTIMSLHDPNLAWKYCDHAILLDGHGHVLSGKCQEVLNEENLSRLYQYPVRRIEQNDRIVFAAD